jgi:hypothetical protein
MSAEAKQPQGLVPGRIVHYVDAVHGTRAAIVTGVVGVAEDAVVNLSVFLHSGAMQYKSDVRYDKGGAYKTWHWMFEGQENRYRSDPPSEMPTMKEPTYPGAITLKHVERCVEETMLRLGAAKLPEALKSLETMEGVVNVVVQKREADVISYADERMKQHERKWHEGPKITYLINAPTEAPTLKPQDVEKVVVQKGASVGKSEDPLAHRRAKMNTRAALLSMRGYMLRWIEEYARSPGEPVVRFNQIQKETYVMYLDAIDAMLDEAKA